MDLKMAPVIEETPLSGIEQNKISGVWHRLRRLLFWLHLICGVMAAALIFVMAVTGTLLIFEKQIVLYSDNGYLPSVSADGMARLPLESLLEKVKTASGKRPTAISV